MPTEMAPLPHLVLYSRPGCHLCGEARDLLTALLAERAATGRTTPELQERNIEDDADLHRRFLTTIPVVEIAGHRLELATSPAKLRRLLSTALDEPATTGTPNR
jgi:glutaredoxin